jgi:exopolyphosphatase/guanosine-5'-triphosphate,3'-diphosphate pyrophosphatase
MSENSAQEPQRPEVRTAAIRAVMDRLDPEPEHGRQVWRLACRLFDETRPVHGLDDAARSLLEAAALMHDVGFRVGASGHHKHSRDWIMAHDLPGFSEEERGVIACVARYHRAGHPDPKHKVYRDLPGERQELTRRLAAILRIADGLDRAHLAATRGLRVETDGDCLRIHAMQDTLSETDIWGAMRKRYLFEEVYGVRVEVLPECARGSAEEPPDAAGPRAERP